MYVRKTNRKTHKKYSIEEKNRIVLLALDEHISIMRLVREYDIASDTVLYHWIEQYKKYGTCVDNRGKGSKSGKRGRKKKLFSKPVDECTKEELIERVEFYEEIKKYLADFDSQKLKKNIN